MLAACDGRPDETVVLRLTARATTTTGSQSPSAAVTPGTGQAPSLREPGTPSAASAPAPPPALAPSATPAPTPTPTPSPTPSATVDVDGVGGRLLEVIDGDTFTVRIPSGEATVRVLGIDAPEFDDAGQRQLAEEARDTLRALIGDGPLRLVADTEPTDAGGRLLRHVFRADRLLAAELARQGWARALPVSPNLAHREAIDRAVAEARAGDKGMWALGVADISLTVDKIGEVVTLANHGPSPLDIGGWWLVSLRGKQGYRFPPGTTIALRANLTVVSGQASGTHRFQQRNVWNNSDPDPAELRRPDGRIVAVWDDSESQKTGR